MRECEHVSVLDTSAATARRYPSPSGRLPDLPAVGEVAAALADIEALLPKIRDWLAE